MVLNFTPQKRPFAHPKFPGTFTGRTYFLGELKTAYIFGYGGSEVDFCSDLGALIESGVIVKNKMAFQDCYQFAKQVKNEH